MSAERSSTAVNDDEPLARLRVRPANVYLFKGFGPLAAGVLLFLAMLLLAPSVAPERVIEKVDTDTSPTTVAPDTTTTVAPGATTTVAP